MGLSRASLIESDEAAVPIFEYCLGTREPQVGRLEEGIFNSLSIPRIFCVDSGARELLVTHHSLPAQLPGIAGSDALPQPQSKWLY